MYIYEGQSKISDSFFISDRVLLVLVVFVLIYNFKTSTDIIVHSPVIQLICETVAKQRKVIPTASRRHYQFSNERHKFHKSIFKTVETVYERGNHGLSEEQGIGRFHSRLFFNVYHNRATSTKKKKTSFNGIDKMASNVT